MHPSLRRVDHRPWAPPERPWAGRQSWCDLLFAHYPVTIEALRPLVPPELEIDAFDGETYAAVVPFRMEGVTARFLPDIPGFSSFPELNVRLYVRHGDRPGVWFLSLDADNGLAVWGARRFFHLPYSRAAMQLRDDGRRIHYESRRSEPPGPAALRGRYGPTSEPYEATPGSLEHFLTERYCLYAKAPDGALFRTEVHHAPWPLQRAEAELDECSMLEVHGLDVPPRPALLHFARRIDVIVWAPQRVA